MFAYLTKQKVVTKKHGKSLYEAKGMKYDISWLCLRKFLDRDFLQNKQ